MNTGHRTSARMRTALTRSIVTATALAAVTGALAPGTAAAAPSAPDRKLTLQIQAAAANSGVNPNLVAAAKKALAGTDDAVTEFLKADNLYRARRQSIQPWDPKLAGRYLRHTSTDGGQIVNDPLNATSKAADRSRRHRTEWRIRLRRRRRQGREAVEVRTGAQGQQVRG
ncbi:hypothetical protein ACIRFF_04780 [Streptomyces cyaneofuscatus]